MALIDSLISYFKMDEASGNAVDSHGSNTPVDNNTVGSTTGKISNARQFVAASSEFFSIADNASVSLGDTDFTLQAWVYLDSKPGPMSIVGKDASGTREYYLQYASGTDRFAWIVFNVSDGVIGTATANILGSPSAATWYLVHAWHDSVANEIGISVNAGTANTVATTGTAPNNDTGAFQIGAREFVGNRDFWNGRIDEVGMWRRALSAAERTSLYNAGAGLAYPFTVTLLTLLDGLQVYWCLDEASGDRADSFGSNTLTDINTCGSATGKISNAADFIPANLEFLKRPSTAAVVFADEACTFNVWLKADDISVTRAVFAKWGSDGTMTSCEYALRRLSGNVFNWRVGDGGATGVSKDHSLTVAVSTWYMVTCYHDPVANLIGIAVNGGAFETASCTTGIFSGVSDFCIGRPGEFNGQYWDGLVDEVGIWRRVLSAAEVTQLYNSGNGLAYPFGVVTAPRALMLLGVG